MPRGVKLVADQYLEIVAVIPGTKSVMRLDKLSAGTIMFKYAELLKALSDGNPYSHSRREDQRSGSESEGTVSGSPDISEPVQGGDSYPGGGNNVSRKDHGGKPKA